MRNRCKSAPNAFSFRGLVWTSHQRPSASKGESGSDSLAADPASAAVETFHPPKNKRPSLLSSVPAAEARKARIAGGVGNPLHLGKIAQAECATYLVAVPFSHSQDVDYTPITRFVLWYSLVPSPRFPQLSPPLKVELGRLVL